MAENFEERLPYLMRRVSSALTQRVDRTLREFSLTHAQLGALAQLGLVAPESLSGATLGQRIGVTAQSMSTAIAGLRERGLVDREPHPTHGRILQVRITPEGAELLARAQAAIKKVEDRTLAFLDDEQQRQLQRVLRSMMQAMDLYLYFPDADDND
ncbi:MarR family winged helix-turn-helix transcriptional regulator [Streptomyces sp. NPDC096048]|uniref:MarR family winged helix-turn-helix transcriptional regulator n=1 Tax=Streptomyces sp. NPDC096048 TaxID=3366072 RepID=UPI0038252BD7